MPKHLLWPISKDTENPENQSKREASTCGRCEARENVRACESWFALALLLIGRKSGANSLNQSLSVVMQNQSKRKYFFRHSSKNRSMRETFCFIYSLTFANDQVVYGDVSFEISMNKDAIRSYLSQLQSCLLGS